MGSKLQWLALCDRCKFRRTAPDELIETHDGLMVCHPRIKDACFEPRHPLEALWKQPTEDVSVPYVRKEPPETYVSVTYTTEGVQETTIPSGNFTTNNQTIED